MRVCAPDTPARGGGPLPVSKRKGSASCSDKAGRLPSREPAGRSFPLRAVLLLTPIRPAGYLPRRLRRGCCLCRGPPLLGGLSVGEVATGPVSPGGRCLLTPARQSSSHTDQNIRSVPRRLRWHRGGILG